MKEKKISTEAQEIHRSSPVVDAHCDTLARCVMRKWDFARNLKSSHIDLFKLEQVNLKLQVFASFLHPSQKYRGFMNLLPQLLKKFETTAEEHPDRLILVRTGDDINSVLCKKGTGGILGLEGAHILEGDMKNYYKLYNSGLRLITLTWNNSNEFADGCFSAPISNGLSSKGRQLVKEMNRMGVIIDLSHASSDTLKQTLSISKKPLLISHSCCKEICDIPRNLSDDEIRMVAESGGVIGINFYPLFLDQKYMQEYFARYEERIATYKIINRQKDRNRNDKRREKRRLFTSQYDDLPDVNYRHVVDHIEHVINTGGEDHVGLGSDFDGIPVTPRGLNNVLDLFNLTDEMLLRGWKHERIKKILGGNLIRLFKDVLNPN